jgi:hypothetical protein
VEGEPWHFAKEMEPGGEYDILLVADDSYRISFIILPFSNGREFKVTTAIRDYDFKVKTMPKTPEDMKKFIDEFITNDLTKIVKYIKNKQ